MTVIKVCVCACASGPQEPSELREYLSGPAMTVEVHDRDRKTEDIKLKASLFGDDLEDEKISNVGTVASECSMGKGREGHLHVCVGGGEFLESG